MKGCRDAASLPSFRLCAAKSFGRSGGAYDWRLGQWTVPINLNVAKVFKIAGQRVQIGVGGRYWAVRPDGGRPGRALQPRLPLSDVSAMRNVLACTLTSPFLRRPQIRSPALASEGGASFYIPGLSVPMGGFVPPPGLYFDSTAYFYKAKLGGGRNTLLGGNVVAEVRAQAKADFLTALWVTRIEILGGNLAFAASLPFGEVAVHAGVIAQRLASIGASADRSDSVIRM